MDGDGLVAIFEKNNPAEKRFLFTKMFVNSTNVLKVLEIFPLGEIKQFLDEFRATHYNREYLQRKRDIVRNVMLNEPVHAVIYQGVVIRIHPVPLLAFVMSADQLFQHQR